MEIGTNPSRYPVIAPGHTLSTVTDKISSIVLRKRAPMGWWIAIGITGAMSLMLLVAIVRLVTTGIGIWGNNQPVGWGFDIINFVWWIGIGHAGTLISAVLLLLRQAWRTSINRFAEAMTLFAVANAGLYPLLHTGRPWLAYWLLPYPNTMGTWPQFRSPLVWDVFAVSTYATVSLLFWYVGLIPDLATLRDRAKRPIAKVLYGIFAMGWRGAARHWERYETAYLLLAGLATPLVVSVHTVVSFDFAAGVVPGWHTTVFPPYFVRRDLRRLRDGADARDPAARDLQARGLHHHASPREHGEGDARDRPDRHLRLRDRSVHGLVFGQPVRVVHDPEPTLRPVQGPVLVAAPLQRPRAAGPVVPESAQEHLRALRRRDVRQRRDVARALHHHRHEPPPRFPPLDLGDVPRDRLGLRDVSPGNW